jgi:hypothetical protein
MLNLIYLAHSLIAFPTFDKLNTFYMKKFFILGGIASMFVLASCSSSEKCLTCTGLASALNACENDTIVTNNGTWEQYVAGANIGATFFDETCSEN